MKNLEAEISNSPFEDSKMKTVFHSKYKIFPIFIGDLCLPDNSENYLEYAPLSGSIALAAEQDVAAIEDDLAAHGENGLHFRIFYPDGIIPEEPALKHSPEEYSRMTVIPTSACNFNCSYCYSAAGRDNRKISEETIRSGVDFLLRPNRTEKKFYITISGGGEPLTAWDEIRFLLKYSYKTAETNGYSLFCMIITNGSLLDQKKIELLNSYGVHICVSFEITETAQNRCRGHYQAVCRALELLKSNHSDYSISATITPENVEELPEIFRELQKKFADVRNISLEPVTLNSGFSSPDSARNFYMRFCELFEQRKSLTQQHIFCSPLDFLDRTVSRICPGKLTLTPHGTFSICHCVSSPLEERYAGSVYGGILPSGEVQFDYSKFRSLLESGSNHAPECGNCFAKYNCGGFCLTRQACYDETTRKVYCDFIREFIRRELYQRLKARRN